MSLRSKIVLILVTVVVAYSAVDNGTLRIFADHAFGRWEREVAEEDLARVRRRIDAELEDLRGKARVHAGVDELGTAVARKDPAFVASRFGAPAMERAGVDLFYICDANGKVLWGSVLEPGARAPMRLTEFPREALSPNHPAILFHADQDEIAGVLMTGVHPLLFGTVPIPGPDGALFEQEEPGDEYRRLAHGAIVLGRFLGPELKQRIVGEELTLTAGAEGLGQRGVALLESGTAGLPAELARADGGRLFKTDGDELHAFQLIGSLRTGEPLVLHVSLPRTIAAHERLSVNYALLSTLIGGTLILFVLLRLLQRIVIVPLSTLTEKAVEIGRRDDTTIRVGMERKDEIGLLAGEFDRMLGKLARSREQVIETARLAGMSEIATGVLHNVGNVLNSVNVSASLATRRTEELSLHDLELLVGVLQRHERDLAAFVAADPRGKHLVPFLMELTKALAGQRAAIRDELTTLNQGIEHIAELVRAQQTYAGAKGVFEKASLAEQLEAALSICSQALDANPEIEVVRELEALPAVRVDKHKLMEILVNLIQNANQALAERGGKGQHLTVRLSRLDERTARIEIRDDGVGIARENLTRVFQHGFTTKRNGHGFGLHVSANAATEMGAKLHAHSDGPGQGASFFLDIPITEPVEEAALAAA